ncbi:MAG: exodeoxyribonuclease VII small subunit [Clostridia bacterium]|nr:exodeoxyribonuclease VII small subunit [Clostridia bacterium]
MAENKKETGFEQNLKRLDEIVALLEKDSVPLDELLRLYEEGVGLIRLCNTQLDSAQQKVKLLQISPDGTKAHLVDFSEESEDRP